MTVYTVAVAGQFTPRAETLLHTVLATVPDHFRLVGNEAASADVVAISGASGDWTAHAIAAIDRARQALMLVSPGPLSAQAPSLNDVLAHAAAKGLGVCTDVGFADDPSLLRASAELRSDIGSSLILDSHMSCCDGSLGSAFVQQLATLSLLVGGVGALHLTHRAADQYVLTGRLDALNITLTGLIVPQAAPHLRAEVIGRDCRWNIQIGGGGFAAPSRLTRFDKSGSHTYPAVFESPHRATWRRLHNALKQKKQVADGTQNLAGYLAESARLGFEPLRS